MAVSTKFVSPSAVAGVLSLARGRGSHCGYGSCRNYWVSHRAKPVVQYPTMGWCSHHSSGCAAHHRVRHQEFPGAGGTSPSTRRKRFFVHLSLIPTLISTLTNGYHHADYSTEHFDNSNILMSWNLSDPHEWLQALVLLLCASIFACFIYELAAVKPDWVEVAKGLIPRPEILTNPDMLYLALGILGKRSNTIIWKVAPSTACSEQ